jgi:hypothetical protein
VLQKKAEYGPKSASERVHEFRKQIWFDMLPPERQRKILHRREARKKSRQNALERQKMVKIASIHRWSGSELQPWICDAISATVKKYYHLKKSGVRLSLDQKHAWMRTVHPIEHALRPITAAINAEILKQQEAQASAATPINSRKSVVVKLTVDETPGGSSPSSRPQTGENLSRPGTGEEDISRPGTGNKENAQDDKNSKDKTDQHASKKSSKSGKKEQQKEAEPGEEETLSHSEADKKYVVAINYFSKNISAIFISFIDNPQEKPCNQCGIIFHSKVMRSMQDALDMLENNAIAKLLPPDQYQDKLLTTASKQLIKWDLLADLAYRFAHSINFRETTWRQDVVMCICYCVVVKFYSEKYFRDKGNHVAASRIQGLVRGVLVRKKVRAIWAEAEEESERQMTQRLSRSTTLEPGLHRGLSRAFSRKASMLNEEAENKQRVPDSVDWALTQVLTSPTLSSVTLTVQIKKGSKHFPPLKRRQKSIRCLARITKQPQQLPDIGNSVDTALSELEIKQGEIEVLLDDLQRLNLKNTESYWVLGQDKTYSELFAVCKWDDETDGENESNNSMAKCTVAIQGLLPYRRYRVCVLTNALFCPTPPNGPNKAPILSQNSLETVRICNVIITTAATFPLTPKMNPEDILHYDAKQLPHLLRSESDHTVHAGMLVSDEMSAPITVVDKIQALNVLKKKNHGVLSKSVLSSFSKSMNVSQLSDKTHSVDSTMNSIVAIPTTHPLHRILACRITWTVPYSNGSAITSYEVQKRLLLPGNSSDMADRWVTIATTPTPSYSDFIEQKFDVPNPVVMYRVRACNEIGWGQYSAPLNVDVTPTASCTGNDGQGNVLSAPIHSASTDTRGSTLLKAMNTKSLGVNSVNALKQFDDLMCVHPTVEYCSNTDLQAAGLAYSPISKRKSITEDSHVPDSNMEGKHVPLADMKHYHEDSVLGGDVLEGVTTGLQKWLSRLANVCPLDQPSQPLMDRITENVNKEKDENLLSVVDKVLAVPKHPVVKAEHSSANRKKVDTSGSRNISKSKIITTTTNVAAHAHTHI